MGRWGMGRSTFTLFQAFKEGNSNVLMIVKLFVRSPLGTARLQWRVQMGCWVLFFHFFPLLAETGFPMSGGVGS